MRRALVAVAPVLVLQAMSYSMLWAANCALVWFHMAAHDVAQSRMVIVSVRLM